MAVAQMSEPPEARRQEAAPLIVCEGLGKLYHLGGEDIWALRDVNVAIAEGEFVAVTGPSGSGKSTFLNLLGTLDRQTHGRMTVDGLDVTALAPGALARFRNRYLGFVFQHFHLLPRTTAWDNVELPLLYGPMPRAARARRVRACLELVEMDHRAGHMPSELSGGQQQRVAIARALAAKPRILLADEPTGALDSRTAEEILGLFQILHESGITVVLITHDAGVAATAHRRLRFLDGRLLDDAP